MIARTRPKASRSAPSTPGRGLPMRACMAERSDLARLDATGHLPTLGACLPRIASRFTLSGALGVVVVDASALTPIEVAYGGEALRCVTDALGALVADVAGDALGIDDL